VNSVAAYEAGDFVKVEFKGAADPVGEWMWVRVESADDEKRLVLGSLDNEPVLDYCGKLRVGSQLAISYDKIREHRKPSEFPKHS
jgi:hypothetical protein